MASIDKIIVNDGGVQKTLTPAEWKALPLPQRVKFISSNPTFSAGGLLVPAKEAIAQLR